MASKLEEVGESQLSERDHGKQMMDSGSSQAGTGPDVVSMEGVDQALMAKMDLVNDVCHSQRNLSLNSCLPRQAIDRIGFTPYHTKLFFLNGFG
jgi:hypothetical protein